MITVWLLFVFFCKQKTAYDMRISDWSSDVCSSDLAGTASGNCWRSAGLCAVTYKHGGRTAKLQWERTDAHRFLRLQPAVRLLERRRHLLPGADRKSVV